MADTTTISDLTEKQTLVDTDKILVEDTNGVGQALLGSAITDKINGALANYQNIFTYYASGFRGIYKISIPFTTTNTTSQGQILISGRTGNSWIINFYNIYSTETENKNAIKVYQFKGDYYDSLFNSIVKFDYDTVNNKINIYLKHDNYNSRITFTVSGGYRLGDNYENIQIQALTDITEYTNASYSKTIEKLVAESEISTMVTRAFELTESTATFDINNLWAKLPNNTFVSTFYYMCDGGQRTGVYTKYSNAYGWVMVGFRTSFDIYTVNNNVVTKKL